MRRSTVAMAASPATAGTGGADDKEAAHEGVVREPASAEACGDCHPDQVAADAEQPALATWLAIPTVLAARSAPETRWPNWKR